MRPIRHRRRCFTSVARAITNHVGYGDIRVKLYKNQIAVIEQALEAA